jgi:hypothetical protein
MRPIKNVTERHLEAYRLWKIYQNLEKVADELGVHYDTVANWSSFFEWRRKLAEDIANGDGNTMAIVAGFRKNAIVIADLIQGWTARVAMMHQTIIEEDREFTDEESKTRERYLAAIRTFDPKALQNLLAYIKTSYTTDLGTGGGREGDEAPYRPGGEAGINFRGPTLLMFGPGKGGENGERSKLFQVQGTGSKSRARIIGHRPASLEGQPVSEGNSGGVDEQKAPGAGVDRVANSPWA